MEELAVTRSPELIATEINIIKDQTRSMLLNSAIEIGRRLVEVKELIPHGGWGTWLATTVNYSQRTAEKFMKLFEQYGELQLTGGTANSNTFSNLNVSQAVALLDMPFEERADFVKNQKAETMSVREIAEAVRARNEAIVERDAAIREKDEAKQAAAQSEEQLRISQELASRLTNEQQVSARELAALQANLEKARSSGASEAELNDLRTKLHDAEAKVQALSTALQAAPVESDAIIPDFIEATPEDVKQELAALRESNAQLEEQLAQSNGAFIRFGVCMDNIRDDYRQLIDALRQIEDSEISDQCRNDAIYFLDGMRAQLL